MPSFVVRAMAGATASRGKSTQIRPFCTTAYSGAKPFAVPNRFFAAALKGTFRKSQPSPPPKVPVRKEWLAESF